MSQKNRDPSSRRTRGKRTKRSINHKERRNAYRVSRERSLIVQIRPSLSLESERNQQEQNNNVVIEVKQKSPLITKLHRAFKELLNVAKYILSLYIVGSAVVAIIEIAQVQPFTLNHLWKETAVIIVHRVFLRIL